MRQTVSSLYGKYNKATVRRYIPVLVRQEARNILAQYPITDVDTTAVDMINKLDEELMAAGIQLILAELKDPVLDKIKL